jgi:hypothetical protein
MEQIIGAIIFIIIIIAQIIKSIKESSAPSQPPKTNQRRGDEAVFVSRPKPSPSNPNKQHGQRPTERPSWRDERSVFDVPKAEPLRQKALVKKLSPQGEGQRFAVDPGTLNTTHIVAPTIDPTVKPELESITGIYEQGVTFGESAPPAISLNLSDWLARPEGICQAVLFAEILNRPAWQETSRG